MKFILLIIITLFLFLKMRKKTYYGIDKKLVEVYFVIIYYYLVKLLKLVQLFTLKKLLIMN